MEIVLSVLAPDLIVPTDPLLRWKDRGSRYIGMTLQIILSASTTPQYWHPAFDTQKAPFLLGHHEHKP